MSGVRFFYIPTTDLDATRRFYSGLVGLEEIYHSTAEGMLAYDCDGFQFSFFVADGAVRQAEGWALQPGWSGGTEPAISWSVEFDERGFRDAVAALQAAGVAARHDTPQWVGYWSYRVQDPMGNTVELSWPPPVPPVDPTW